MKVALIQSFLVWENPTANRNYFEEKINAITEKLDLIVLQEMFSTGFTMGGGKDLYQIHNEKLGLFLYQSLYSNQFSAVFHS